MCTRLALSAAAVALAGCQFFFPLPLEPEMEAPASNQAVRTTGAPFIEGEVFDADVFVENVAVGKASFKVGRACLADGKRVLPVDGSGKMGGFLSFLSSGGAETHALIDLDTNTSLESKWDIEMDDKRTFAELDFAAGRYRIHQLTEVAEKKPKNLYRRVELPSEQIPHDGHSLLGHFRRWDPPIGTTGFVYATMGRHLIRADVAFTGPEKLQTAMGERDAVRIDGVGVRISEKTLDPLPHAVPKPFTLWFGADDDRTPLRLVVQTDLAELTIDVTKAQKGVASSAAPEPCSDRVDKIALGKARPPRKNSKLAHGGSDEPNEPTATTNKARKLTLPKGGWKRPLKPQPAAKDPAPEADTRP